MPILECHHYPMPYFKADSTGHWLAVNNLFLTNMGLEDHLEQLESRLPTPMLLFERPDIFAYICDTLARTQVLAGYEIKISTIHNDVVWKSLYAHILQRHADGSFSYEAWLCDIDPLKRTQEYLLLFRKAYEQRLQLTSTVFNNMKEGIFVTDMHGSILEVNDAFVRISGYTREEAIGKKSNLMRSGYHDQQFYQQMWTAISQVGYWAGEITNRRKNGEIFKELLTISSILSALDGSRQYIATFSAMLNNTDEEIGVTSAAYYDPLTKLPNRILFLDRLNVAIDRANRLGTLLAVCSFDLDNFKYINDAFGHAVGDQLIIEVASRIQLCLRQSDSTARPGGGDEFVVLVQDVQEISDVERIIVHLMSDISKPYLIRSIVIHPTVSVGISIHPFHGSTADELLRNADKAMYHSKDTGKNHFTLYETEQSQFVQTGTAMYSRLYEALGSGELCLYYQPKVEMKASSVYGIEALIRWRHPEKGLLTPIEFLPLIEHTDLMMILDDWVQEQALIQLEAWQEAGLRLKISVNVSARRFRRSDFVDHVQRLLDRHPDVCPNDLELELLETDELGDLKDARQTIERCRFMGLRVSLDDFGSGYSSLYYLSHLPLDTLKIDQDFVRNMENNEGNLAIIRAVIELSHVFHCDVVAEGVETLEHATTLMQLGCNRAQGYLIARPMPPDQVMHWVQSWTGFHENR